MAYLLGIRSKHDVEVHFAKGQLFENFIILEKMKTAWNFKTHEQFYFWRDLSGNEVDLLIEDGLILQAVEIKSSKTIHPNFFQNLKQFSKVKQEAKPFLVYGGHEYQKRTDGTVLGFKQLDEMKTD